MPSNSGIENASERIVIIALFFLEGLSRGVLLAIIPLDLLIQLETVQYVTWFYSAVAIFVLVNILLVPVIFNWLGGRTVITLFGSDGHAAWDRVRGNLSNFGYGLCRDSINDSLDESYSTRSSGRF